MPASFGISRLFAGTKLLGAIVATQNATAAITATIVRIEAHTHITGGRLCERVDPPVSERRRSARSDSEISSLVLKSTEDWASSSLLSFGMTPEAA